jgi:galactokinase
VRYAQAAARVLKVTHGMQGHVSGSLIGSGLSSSASVGLAYLKALAEVNNVQLSNEQLVKLEYQIEHDELKLQIGLLDPLTIVYGQRDALLIMDTIIATVSPIPDPPSRHFAWIVAYSGVSRELTKSGFNVRVEECRQAASLLIDGAKILSDIPWELFEEKKMALPENLRKRATHFFTEVERVYLGAKAWKESNLEVFGQLMNQSCASSINNYESGSEVLIAKKGLAESARMQIAEKFEEKHPDLPSKVFIAETGDGLTSLPDEKEPEARV